MVPPKILLSTLIFLLLKVLINSQNLHSPCPRLFRYTGQNSSEWHGRLTLLSDIDLLDVWLQLTFDRPPFRLENSFGEALTTNGKEYFIEKPNFKLKANTPHWFSFILKCNPNEPPSKLLSFKLNGKLVCPETDNLQFNSNVNDIYKTPLVNGNVSYEGAFPWHAALYYATKENLNYICAASLISKYHVITVAKCVTRTKSPTLLKPEETVILLGKHYLKTIPNHGLQNKSVSQILPHPQYNASEPHTHNIALMKFSTAAEFTQFVSPISLWQGSLDFSAEGTVVGWGFDKTAKFADGLIQTKMLVVPQKTCMSSIPNFSSNTYCAGFSSEALYCNGNSGASMVFLRHNSESSQFVWQLRGLVSIALSLQNRCNASHYTAFTDTARYLDWIEKSIV